MHAICIDQPQHLDAYRQRWDELAAGNVFRSWHWTVAWWKQYGELRSNRALRVICVMEGDGRPAAILPCYAEQSLARGRVWRLCGDGEVCSDHVGLLIADQTDQALIGHAVDLLAARDDWDLLDLAPIDADDLPTLRFVEELRERGCSVTRHDGPATWQIDLPDTWDEYLASLSKTHRKKFRRIESRLLDSGMVEWHVLEDPSQFEKAWEIFEQLHRLRWQSVGRGGCFGSGHWQAFHEEVAPQLLEQGQLRLAWLTYEGEPLAAEYQFLSDQSVYAYQGGLNPELLQHHPGRLAHLCGMRLAIEEGRQTFDLLRGDEPYKQHYRATPRKTYRIETTPARRLAQWRHWACTGAMEAGRVVKRVAGLLS